MIALKTRAAALSALFALALVTAQFGVLRLAPSAIYVRIALPLTIAAVPVVLWPLRARLGVCVMTVGLLANLAVILANGGLMPIERDTVVDAVGPQRAAHYATGEWMAGSKDLLVPSGAGRAVVLGDSLVVHIGGGGFVASPGDVVVWGGLLLLAAELSFAWQPRSARRNRDMGNIGGESTAPERAEGGAATSS